METPMPYADKDMVASARARYRGSTGRRVVVLSTEVLRSIWRSYEKLKGTTRRAFVREASDFSKSAENLDFNDVSSKDLLHMSEPYGSKQAWISSIRANYHSDRGFSQWPSVSLLPYSYDLIIILRLLEVILLKFTFIMELAAVLKLKAS